MSLKSLSKCVEKLESVAKVQAENNKTIEDWTAKQVKVNDGIKNCIKTNTDNLEKIMKQNKTTSKSDNTTALIISTLSLGIATSNFILFIINILSN